MENFDQQFTKRLDEEGIGFCDINNWIDDSLSSVLAVARSVTEMYIKNPQGSPITMPCNATVLSQKISALLQADASDEWKLKMIQKTITAHQSSEL